MSFTLWAELVRAPGTAANSPISPAAQSKLMCVERRDIFQSSLLNEQSIEPPVSMSEK